MPDLLHIGPLIMLIVLWPAIKAGFRPSAECERAMEDTDES